MTAKVKNFNSKHLGKGDPLPPFAGIPRLYNMRFCPYAQRTVLVLNAKNIDYEVINVNLADKPEWLTSKSPLGKVPAIEIEEGVTVFESLVTAEYLDDVYPQRRLQSDDPLTRARDKIIIEVSTALSTLLFKWIQAPARFEREEQVKQFYKALDFIQDELVKRESKFLGGSQPGYVDYMIWPWFERLTFALKDEHFPLPEKYAKMTKYIEDVRQDPAVSQYLIQDDTYATIFQGYRVGAAPKFDYLD